jgi:hypothetical protein
MDRLDRAIRDGQISKSKTFKDINIAQSKLTTRLETLETKKRITEEEIELSREQLRILNERRKEIGFEHEIVVTEHAMLRYIERYMGVDMEEVWQAIIKLPKKDITKYGNTIVTVFPIDGEHTEETEEIE